mgnify:CR=1 FL=1
MKKRMNKEKEEKMENAVDFIALISNKEAFVAAYNAAENKESFLAEARKAKEAAEKALAEKALAEKALAGVINEFFGTATTTTVADLTAARRQVTQGRAVSATAVALFPEKGLCADAYSSGDVKVIAKAIADDIMSGAEWKCVGRSLNKDKEWIRENPNLVKTIYERCIMHISNCRTPNRQFSAPVL